MQKMAFWRFSSTFSGMKPLTDTDYIPTLAAQKEYQKHDFKFEESQIPLSVEKRIKKKGLLVKANVFRTFASANATLDIFLRQRCFSIVGKKKTQCYLSL